MKRKRISFLAMLILAVILLMPASIQAATKPGAVKLTKITAVDYNKISIKWKKASGATNYIVYYKKAGNSKWIKLKTLGNTKSSYTHTSSSKYPIVVGQKYQYTVKAYDKNTKKYGSYNTKGLTVTASLKMVTGIEAKIEGTTVKLTWNKISGADKYAIYAKIKASDKWSKIITVKDTSSFIDVNPCVDCTNYYSVRGYSSSTKAYGVMNKTGVSIYVKDSDEVKPTITPEPTDTPDPDDEVDHSTPEQKAQEVFNLVNVERMKAWRRSGSRRTGPPQRPSVPPSRPVLPKSRQALCWASGSRRYSRLRLRRGFPFQCPLCTRSPACASGSAGPRKRAARSVLRRPAPFRFLRPVRPGPDRRRRSFRPLHTAPQAGPRR